MRGSHGVRRRASVKADLLLLPGGGGGGFVRTLRTPPGNGHAVMLGRQEAPKSSRWDVLSSMTDEPLDSLALGYINQERSFSPEEVLRIWDCCRIVLAFQHE